MLILRTNQRWRRNISNFSKKISNQEEILVIVMKKQQLGRNTDSLVEKIVVIKNPD